MTALTTFLASQRREINAALGDVRVVHRKIVAGKTSEAERMAGMAIRRLTAALKAQDAAIKLEAASAVRIAGGGK